MAFREVPVFEVREVLRLWLLGHGLRKIASMVRCDRKTVTALVETAKGLGLSAGDSAARLSDGFVGEVIAVMRPPKPDRHGESWALLVEHRSKIVPWVEAGDVPATKMVELLARQGVQALFSAPLLPLPQNLLTDTVGVPNLRDGRRPRRTRPSTALLVLVVGPESERG